MERVLVITKEENPSWPREGFRLIFKWFRWSDSHTSHAAIVQLYCPSGKLIVDEYFHSKSQAKDYVHSIKLTDLEREYGTERE